MTNCTIREAPTLPLTLQCSACPRNLSVIIDSKEKRKGETISGRIGIVHAAIFQIYSVTRHQADIPDDYTYAHTQTIYIHPKGNCIILGGWIETSCRTLLILITKDDLFFYNDEGTRILGKHLWDKIKDGYSRAFSSSGNTVLIGNNHGGILLFEYSSREASVIFKRKIEGLHIMPIYSMDVCNELLINGDILGNVSVWKVRIFDKVADFPSEKEDCVTNCLLWNHLAIASFGSGIIKLFNHRTKRLDAKVDAHSRWIISMDLTPVKGLLLTLSEDNYVKIWQLTTTKHSISLKIQLEITKANLLVGGRFLSITGNMFAVSAYGSKEVLLYYNISHI